MNRIQGLGLQKESLLLQIRTTHKISEYQKAKEKLKVIEMEIAKENGTFKIYSLVQKLKERIDELETNKARAMIEKKKCENIDRYRKIVDSIELINQSIEYNKQLLKKYGAAI